MIMTAEAPTSNCVGPTWGGGDSCPSIESTTLRLEQSASSIFDEVGAEYTIDLPDVQALSSVLAGCSLAVFVGSLIATAVYGHLIKQQRGTSPLRRCLIGSALLATCILLPYALIDAVQCRNSAARFAMCSLFVLYTFRTLEAAFGFVPEGARPSLGLYCAYFALPFDMMFDERTSKPIMANQRDVFNGQVNLFKALAGITVICSILSPLEYEPFGASNAGEFHERIIVRDYFSIKHLGNCFAIAVLFQQALALGDAFVGNLVQTVLGYKVEQSMRNPLLEATSPSDFWGRRWNVLVHSVMKRGVYKPVRKYSSSPTAASLAAFAASGLFHEWLVHAVLVHGRPSASSSGVLLGSNAAFFAWNFAVIASERALAGTEGARSLGRVVPPSCLPFVIIMTSLPVAHWFGSPYLKGNYFADYEKCLFLIRRARAG